MRFGGQQSFIKINDDIYIDKANIQSQVKAINGKIYISNSTLQDNISAINGDVVIINSHAKSNVSTANGNFILKIVQILLGRSVLKMEMLILLILIFQVIFIQRMEMFLF